MGQGYLQGEAYCQGVKVGMLGRQNESNSSYVRLAHTSIFGLCFMSVCLTKSNCNSLIHSSLFWEAYVRVEQKAFYSTWHLMSNFAQICALNPTCIGASA